jgi:hypothetical protein
MPLKVNSTSTVLSDGWAKYTVRITRKDTAAFAIYAVVLLRYVVAKNNPHN